MSETSAGLQGGLYPPSAFPPGIPMGGARTARPFYLTIWYGGTPEERRATPANTYVEARGMTTSLEDGTAYEDWTGSAFVNNIGLGRPEIAKALADQALSMSWLTPAEFASIRLALTRDLLDVLPRHLRVPFYGLGGSDSNEAAIRAARKVTGRSKVLTFKGAYHGDTMTIENVSGTGLTDYGDPRPWAVHTPAPYDFWRKLGDWDRAYEASLDAFARTLKRHGPRSFACVILEPVNMTMGAVPLSRDLSRGIQELCERNGIKLVADEVITGFGRTGRWFGSETVGLRPDAMVFAKGFTGGYAPLGAVVFEREWGERLRRTGFPHGLTFGAHPLGCVAAQETIRVLRREGLVDRARRMGAYLRERLEGIRDEHPDDVRDVRGHGLFLALEVAGKGRRVKGGLHPAWPRVERVWEGLKADGLRVTTNSDGSSLLVCPPFTVTEEQVDRLVSRLDARLAAP